MLSHICKLHRTKLMLGALVMQVMLIISWGGGEGGEG